MTMRALVVVFSKHATTIALNVSQAEPLFVELAPQRESTVTTVGTNGAVRIPARFGIGRAKKLAIRHALEQGFQAVVFIDDAEHAAPGGPLDEGLSALLSALENGADAALLSTPPPAPLARFISGVVSRCSGLKRASFFSSCRAYSLASLSRIPFELNTDDPGFDLEVLLQLHQAGGTISDVSGAGTRARQRLPLRDVLRAARSLGLFVIQRTGLLYSRRFDAWPEQSPYEPKFDFHSSHSRALAEVRDGERVLSLGVGPRAVSEPFLGKCRLSVADLQVPDELVPQCEWTWQGDLDTLRDEHFPEHIRYDRLLLLDIIEHLRSPERLLSVLNTSEASKDSELVITTPNVVFLPVRLMFMFGRFNYGKRGILDLTHCRLFTFASLRRLLYEQSYEILEMSGIPAPFPLVVRQKPLSRVLLAFNTLALKLLPGVFSYQIFVRARRIPELANAVKISKY